MSGDEIGGITGNEATCSINEEFINESGVVQPILYEDINEEIDGLF